MSNKQDPTEPVSDKEKFKPENVADEMGSAGRNERAMENVARGSEEERRGKAHNRTG
jgi:hypothetical protein